MKVVNIPTDSGPIPVMVPNSTMDGDGFYVSYNDYDVAIFGCATTALVQGQMEHFYILDGDHRQAYAKLLGDGFEACFEYFKANITAINKNSEKPALPGDAVRPSAGC